MDQQWTSGIEEQASVLTSAHWRYKIHANNFKLRQALLEVETKTSIVEKLRKDLTKTEMALVHLQSKETQLEDQLNYSKTELQNARADLNQAKGSVEHEREQRKQIQARLENRLRCQTQHILMLKEELESKRMRAVKIDNEKLMKSQMRIDALEKQLEIERRCNLESQKRGDESQTETEDLLEENEKLRKMLWQCQHDMEQIREKHDDLMEEYKALNVNDKDLEEKILEERHIAERRLNGERLEFSKEIERYQKQCREYKEKLEKAKREIELTKSERKAIEINKNDDIEMIQRENESLENRLKQTHKLLQKLERSNEEQTIMLDAKEKELSKLHNTTTDYLQLKTELDGKNLEVCQLQGRIREIENLLFFEQVTKKETLCTKDEVERIEEACNTERRRNEALLKTAHEHKNQIAALEKQVSMLQNDLTESNEKLEKKKIIEATVARFDKEKQEAQKYVQSLKLEFEKIQNEMIRNKEKSSAEKKDVITELQKEQKRGKELEEENVQLKKEIYKAKNIANSNEETKRKLEGANKKYEEAMENMSRFASSAKELEKSCLYMKTELESKKEEYKKVKVKFEEKENEFHKKIKEKETICNDFKEKLAVVEKKLRDKELNVHINEEKSKDKTAREETIAKLEKERAALKKEKEQLKAEVLQRKNACLCHADALENVKSMAKQLNELRQQLEKEREKKIASKTGYKDPKCDNLRKEIERLSIELKTKDKEKAHSERTIEGLRSEINGRRKKYEELASSLVNTKTTMTLISEKASGIEKELKTKVTDLKKDLKKAQNTIKEKEQQNTKLQKEIDNLKILKMKLEEGKDDTNSKNKCTEDSNNEKKRVSSEVQKFKDIIEVMKERIEMIAKDQTKVKREKGEHQDELNRYKDVSKTLERNNIELERAVEDKKTLAAEKQELIIKYEKLKAAFEEENGIQQGRNERVPSSKSNPFEHFNSKFIYEPDFEDEDETGLTEDDHNNENLVENAGNIIERNDEKDIERQGEKEEVNFDNDDEFWDALIENVNKSEKRSIEDIFAKTNGLENDTDTNCDTNNLLAGGNKDDDICASNAENRKLKGPTLPKWSTVEEEEDSLSSFISKHKSKKPKSPRILTSQEKQMAKELGLDDDSLKSTDPVDVYNEDPYENNDQSEKDGQLNEICKDNSATNTQQEDRLSSSFFQSERPLERNGLLPPLKSRSNHPLPARNQNKPKI